VRSLAARVASLIRVDAVWLATEPIDMRAGTETALARVVKVFGAAHPHHAYLFANRRANRSKPSINHALARGVGTDERLAVYVPPSAMFQGSSAS